MCPKESTCGDQRSEGATSTIAPTEILEGGDVPFAEDKTVMKQLVRDGEGSDTPKDRAKVSPVVSSATDGFQEVPYVRGTLVRVDDFEAAQVLLDGLWQAASRRPRVRTRARTRAAPASEVVTWIARIAGIDLAGLEATAAGRRG